MVDIVIFKQQATYIAYIIYIYTYIYIYVERERNCTSCVVFYIITIGTSAKTCMLQFTPYAGITCLISG